MGWGMIFAIIRVSDSTKISEAIKKVFPEDHLALGHDEWLVSFKGTANELTEKIGITTRNEEGKLVKGNLGSVMVLAVSSYQGVADTNTWEWMASRSEN
jgi:hypothetical protein